MSKTLLRAGALSCALLAAAALTAPARAQSTSDIPPPVRYATDENGIDLARGEHLINVTDVSIGPVGRGGLAFTRQLRRNGGGNPYDLGLFLSGGNWIASVGLRSYIFTQSGPTYISTDGSGATLVQNGAARTLTLPDGTVIVYDYNVIATSDSSRKSRATRITHPNGERVDLAWVAAEYCSNLLDNCEGGQWLTVVRLQGVSSPIGYQLHFNYGREDIPFPQAATAWKRLDGITAINTTVDPCDPSAHACTLSQSWPTASYSGSSVTDPEGRTSSFTASGSTFSIRRPGSAGDDVVYTYGADGKIDSVVRDGMSWTYDYSVSGTAATMVVTDPASHVRTIISDIDVGLPTSVENEVGQTTSYQYDSSGRPTRATAPEGNYVQYSYDSRGNIVETRFVAKPGSGAADIVTTADFPDTCVTPRTCNQPESTTDARGHTTHYTYDPDHGGLLTATLPAPTATAVRPQTRYSYASLAAPDGPNVVRLGNVSVCRTQASCDGTDDETEMAIAYNHPNLLVSAVTRRAGDGSPSITETMGYDDIGNLVGVDGPLTGTDDTVRTRYDLNRQATATLSPDPDGAGSLKPRAQRITRDAATGLVTRVETGTLDNQSTDMATFASLEQLDIVYDSSARPVRQALSGAGGGGFALTDLGYDAEGLPHCTAVRMNVGSPPPSACTAGSSTYGADRITRTSYDAAHRVTLVQTGYGTSDMAGEVATTYTPNGRVATATDAEGNMTTYVHGAHDRLRRVRFPSPTTDGVSSTSDYEEFTYDPNGNLTGRRLRNGSSIAFSYDDLDRVTLKDVPGDDSDVSYGYDNVGQLLSAAGAHQILSFTYSPLGRNLTQSGPLGTVSYQYDLAGRRTRMIWPGSGLFVDYDYLVTGEVTKIRENGATSGIGVLGTYAYDDRGRRVSLTRGNGTVTSYGYDAVSRLSQLVQDLPGTANDLTLGFGYNPAGQIVSNTRSNDAYSFTGHANQNLTLEHNGLNQISGGISIAHGLNGNISEIGTADYGYTSENLMIAAPGPVTLAYDPLLRLYETAGGGGTTRFAYDGSEMIAEYNASNQLQRRFVHGPGVDEPLVWYEGAGTATRRWFHADERGSIVAVSDASGNLVGSVNRYDEYGAPQGTLTGRFGYTGQAWLPEIGLWYYRARMYNPSLGRFMQADPIGYGSGMNLYAYVGGDPVNRVDPSGLTPPPSDDICTGTRICRRDGSGGGFASSTWGPAHRGGEKSDVKTLVGSDGSKTFTTGPWVPITSSFGGGVLAEFEGFQTGGAGANDGRVELACLGPAGLACRAILREALRKIFPKPNPPSLPPGLTPNAFGRALGWPRGQTAPSITPQTIENAIQNARQLGVTQDQLIAWRDFYRFTALRDFGNIAAAHRARFLEMMIGGW